jgi:hypothetical protein
MKKILSIIAAAAVLAATVQLPSNAEKAKTNYIGPQISFGNGFTLFGAKAKFGIADSFSIRPDLAFATGNGGGSGFAYGAAATYDFDLSGQSSTTQFEPYVGIGFLGLSGGGASTTVTYLDLGTDVGLSGVTLNADLKISLSGGGGTLFGIGAGFKF